jgi:uncharacterized protein YcsI (UPF0317 family)
MDFSVHPIRMVLFGGFPPATKGNPRPYGMPPFAYILNDEDVAAVVTYMRQSWGNRGSAVSAADVSRYRVFRDGQLEGEVDHLKDIWREDLVGFALGCSFSFEQALIEDGIVLRHVAQGRNVAMYRTNVQTVAAGPFRGPLVVSMRPLKPADAIRAVQITSRFPNVHGAPVHIGLPAAIGIRDLARPDWGDAVEVRDDELPVFWACGVTPQAVIEEARPELCITHAPGHMLVTDLRNARLAVM